jgi:hypothetical protein
VQVGGQYGIEIVLDGRLPGHQRARSGRRVQLAPKVVGVALGVLEVEGRLDVRVLDSAAGSQRSDARARQYDRSEEKPPSELVPRPLVDSANREDDRERPLRPVVIGVLEYQPRSIGVRPGNREGVGEERRQVGGGIDACARDGRPDEDDGDAKAQDRSDPALVHPGRAA